MSHLDAVLRFIIIIIIIIIINCYWVVTGGSGYSTCIQNMKLVTNKFKSEGLHENHVVTTWNLSICLWTQGNQEKSVSRWPVAGPSKY